MRKHLRKRPSPSMAVALLALFIALSGTTYAATGGNFILGPANTAENQTTLTASVNGGTTGGGQAPLTRFCSAVESSVSTLSAFRFAT
jgi:hypothetical protein